MSRFIIASAFIAVLSTGALAESAGKPCTTEPKEKWMTVEAIEKIVTDHGYSVAKSKVKGTCVEIYAKDDKGARVELFIDPATGNPVGTDWPKK